MKVVITGPAENDLDAIRVYIATDNPVRAASFVSELLDSCLSLGDMPRAFPLIPRYERRGVRRCLHENYLIFYRIEGEIIQVLHILHGAQDYIRILFSDERAQ